MRLSGSGFPIAAVACRNQGWKSIQAGSAVVRRRWPTEAQVPRHIDQSALGRIGEIVETWKHLAQPGEEIARELGDTKRRNSIIVELNDRRAGVNPVLRRGKAPRHGLHTQEICRSLGGGRGSSLSNVAKRQPACGRGIRQQAADPDRPVWGIGAVVVDVGRATFESLEAGQDELETVISDWHPSILLQLGQRIWQPRVLRAGRTAQFWTRASGGATRVSISLDARLATPRYGSKVLMTLARDCQLRDRGSGHQDSGRCADPRGNT